MRKIYLLVALLALACFAGAANIYINNHTGWNNTRLYAWDDGRPDLIGVWPGIESSGSAAHDGVNYLRFVVPDNVFPANLIYNNGNGGNGNQLPDFRVNIAGDYYLDAWSDGMSEVSTGTQPVDDTPTDGDPLIVDNTTPITDANRVIYELNLYDFTSAGTLQAAQAKLADLRKLGIDIVWLMPIYPRGVEGKIGSLGSPYAPRDFLAVNADHGTLQDLKNFVNAAHELDMQVWLDWVPNHTGLDHVWVTSHPEYYVKKNGQIVHPNDYGDVYQLNYANAELCTAMTNAMLYWVNEADIDGFRCDYISSSQIPVSYWQQAIPALQQNNRNKRVWMLGEADFMGETRLYQAGFDFDYAWRFNTAMKIIGTGTDVTGLRSRAQEMITTMSGTNYDDMNSMVYLTNHDDIGNNFSDNYLTQLGTNVAPLTVMFFTFYGMPLLYNGQEIGQTKILNYFNRNTINWNLVNKPLNNTIRALIALKHTCPALADGTKATRAATTWLTTRNANVLAFEKRMGDDVVVVVMNFSDQPATCTLASVQEGSYRRVINSETIASGFGTQYVNLTGSFTISLGAKGYHVYVRGEKPDTNTEIRNQKLEIRNQKVLRDGQLLILRDGRIYNMLGL